VKQISISTEWGRTSWGTFCVVLDKALGRPSNFSLFDAQKRATLRQTLRHLLKQKRAKSVFIFCSLSNLTSIPWAHLEVKTSHIFIAVSHITYFIYVCSIFCSLWQFVIFYFSLKHSDLWMLNVDVIRFFFTGWKNKLEYWWILQFSQRETRRDVRSKRPKNVLLLTAVFLLRRLGD